MTSPLAYGEFLYSGGVIVLQPWPAFELNDDYRARVLQALQYMDEHLAEEIHLEQLAQASMFSPFHFHRLFCAVTGETPNTYLNRVRLERAANWLLKNRSLSVTEIAFACGFSSSAAFARSFKKHFGLAASQFRNEAAGQFKDLLRGVDSVGEARSYPEMQATRARARALVSNVHVCELPSYPVVYLANLQGYSLEHICQTWEKLTRWAGASAWARSHAILHPQMLSIGISMDDPFITPNHKCRYYACLTCTHKPPVGERVGWMEVAAGNYAVCRVSCLPEEIELAYHALYGLWLPDSGCQPADRPTYEIYRQTPDQHPEGHYTMDICLPLR